MSNNNSPKSKLAAKTITFKRSITFAQMQAIKKRVLICPLNWGLGHATRCIPVIKELINQEADVMIASDGDSLELLKKEFPSLKYQSLSTKAINYSASGNMVWQMIKSSPRMFRNIYQEHQQIKKLIKEFNIDIVISDNRYGCWSKNCFSVFITHQLNIQCPKGLKWLQPLLNRINHFFIRKYNECWVPDEKELPGLSGILSHGDYYLPQIHFIGALSRFAEVDNSIDKSDRNKYPENTPLSPWRGAGGEAKSFDLLVILSGLEPQRTIFENQIIEQVSSRSIGTNLQSLIVRGKPKEISVPKVTSTITIVNHLETPLLKFHIQHAKNILCRPGYSTIMDLAVLGRKAIIVPTPGQTEQEYLAGFFHLQKKHFMQLQNQFDLELALKGIEYCDELKIDLQENLLEKNIKRVLNST